MKTPIQSIRDSSSPDGATPLSAVENREVFYVARMTWRESTHWFVSLDGGDFVEVDGDLRGCAYSDIEAIVRPVRGTLPLRIGIAFIRHVGDTEVFAVCG